MSDNPAPNDPQTGNGAVWGDELVDTGDNEPGSQEPPADTTTSDDPSPA